MTNRFVPSVVPFSPVLPVFMQFSAPIHGWIDWTITVGSQTANIRCSCVYDPFPDQFRCIENVIIHGQPGWVDVDQEGAAMIVRFDIEPGMDIGRLRVYTPDSHNDVATMWIDASVAALQFGRAWVSAFASMRDIHDPMHWDAEDGVPGRMTQPLYAINLDWVRGCTHGEHFVSIPWEIEMEIEMELAFGTPRSSITALPRLVAVGRT